MPTLPASTITHADARRAIERLANALGATPLETHFRSSAVVCFEDAQTCEQRGDFLHAVTRAERGLSYLGLVRGEHY